MASGVLAPTVSMVRRWLANDTWELLGGPVPATTASDGERAKRVLARAARGAGRRVGRRRPVMAGRIRRSGGGATSIRPRARIRSQVVGPLPRTPMGGDADTIQAAGYGWRAGSPFTVLSLSVYRQVVDLADPDSASYVIPGGSSGDPDSPHFADQLAEWAAHRRIPMWSPRVD